MTPSAPSGIEPATFRFVAQRLNHCATAVPLRFKEERHILYAMKLRMATSFIGHILRRNFQLKHVTEKEGRIEVTGRRGKRRKQLLDYLKERAGYWKLKEETQNRTLCKRLGTCRNSS